MIAHRYSGSFNSIKQYSILSYTIHDDDDGGDDINFISTFKIAT